MRRLRAVALSSVGASAIAVVCAVSAPAVSTGCQTHQCDGDFVCLNPDPNLPVTCNEWYAPDQHIYYVGQDEIVWETSGMKDPWLDFPGQRTWTMFTVPALFPLLNPPPGMPAQWTLEAPVIWVSTEPNQEEGGDTMTPAAGQLAELSYADQGSVTVFNASCAHYYLRVELHLIRTITSPPDGGP